MKKKISKKLKELLVLLLTITILTNSVELIKAEESNFCLLYTSIGKKYEYKKSVFTGSRSCNWNCGVWGIYH